MDEHDVLIYSEFASVTACTIIESGDELWKAVVYKYNKVVQKVKNVNHKNYEKKEQTKVIEFDFRSKFRKS